GAPPRHGIVTDEEPPERQRPPSPAERAGATPLDPEAFRASAVGLPAERRRTVDEVPSDPIGAGPLSSGVEVRRRRRRRRSTRPWWIAAATLVVIGLVTVAAGWALDADAEVAAAAPPDALLATPVASARRVPEVLVRPVASRNLNAAVQPILETAPADTCLEVRDHSTPATGHRADASLVPASNMKLVVAAAAIDVLGADTRLSTRFATDGTPADGSTVRGNLYMVGGGDPLLTTDGYESRMTHGLQPGTDLEAVADQIVDTGVREITGSIVGDASRYDDVHLAPSWPERYLTQGQVGPLSALMVDDGWRSGGGPTEDPALHAATVLHDLLVDRGVEIAAAPTTGVTPPEAATLTEVPSLTIGELVDEALRFSDNTTTELLVKELGVHAGTGGTTTAGIEELRRWVAASGLPAEGVSFDDGSGLSANDRLTCRFLSALLAVEGPSGVVANGLAVPGGPGTLDDRFLSEPLRSRLRAKTGTLNSVTSLSGWLRTDAAADLAFALLINTGSRNVGESDFALQRQLLEAMLSYPQAPDVATLGPSAPVALEG
ncbi:MAG: D-alanyl-D-alanine carboxypeptidase/D-alanyl-D-alanine-endopeptidase, partial [Microthrixaceae bacterium]